MPCREIWILICSVCLSPSRSETESFVEQLSARSGLWRQMKAESQRRSERPARLFAQGRSTAGLALWHIRNEAGIFIVGSHDGIGQPGSSANKFRQGS